MTDVPPRPDPIGTVAEEAAKLIALLGQRPAERPEPDTASEDTCREHPRAGEALTCALCPLCQGIAVLRTLHPDTVDRLADLATAAAAALRELAATTTAPGASPGAHPGRAGGAGGSGRGHTVDIDVVDEEGLHP